MTDEPAVLDLYACFKCGELWPLEDMKWVNAHHWNAAFQNWTSQRVPICPGCTKNAKSSLQPVGFRESAALELIRGGVEAAA